MAKKASKKRRWWLRPFRRSSPSSSGPPRKRRWLLKSGLAVFVLWLIACFLVVVEPTVNKPTKVDAILVLGPANVDRRADQALALARQKYAPTVVISVAAQWQPSVRAICNGPHPDYDLICFKPSPATTQGEAEEIGRLAKAHHWTSIIVVTSTYHISRARLIVERCMPGKVEMVAAPGKLNAGEWAYQFLYQTGGFVKAFAHSKC